MISPSLHRAQDDLYLRGLFWIIRERRCANGGWPPRNVSKVSGWTTVRMLAALSDRPVQSVARELIDTAEKLDQPEQMP